MDTLLRYDWPGNVRELMNAIERSVVLAQSDYLDDETISIIPRSQKSEQKETFQDLVNKPLEDIEKSAILKTLQAADGNKSETARRLGITRKTLHKKLKQYGMM
jgi:Response regulator containing CheY-like receiver, AAA-type ATPase, and DNA-binding domains